MPIDSTKNVDNSAADFDQSVGEVVNFVGLKGMLKVVPSSNNHSLFLDIESVLLQYNKPDGNKMSTENSEKVKILATVQSIRIVKNCFEISLKEYSSRTAAEHLRGAMILTTKEQIRALSKDQWWVHDLIGMTVYTTSGDLLGTVCDAPGEHGEFLEIKKANDASGKTAIISFAKELFPVVDMKSRRIEMIELLGLFD